MKKWISGLLSLALVLTLFTPIMMPAFAEGAGTQSGKVNYPAVHLRQAPWGDILDLIYEGASVEVVGSQKDSDGNIWYQVNVSSKGGYMYGEYIDLEKVESPVKDKELKGSVKVTWDFARVRQTPWGTVLGQLNRGQTAEVTGSIKDSDGATWYEVKFDGKVGYMHEENVSYSSSSPSTPAPTPKPEPQKPSIEEEAIKGTLKVTWDFARVRQTPWGTILGQLKYDQKTEVSAKTKDSDGATWYKVKFDGKDGYMHEENVVFTLASAPTPKPEKPSIKEDALKGTIKVTWDFARVRQTPWGTVLGQLTRGQSAEASAKTKDSDGATWYKVKYSGQDGYMHEDNISFTAASTPKPEPEKPVIKDEIVKGTVKVTWDFARVRQTPWGTVLGQLNRGQSAEVTDNKKDSDGATWYKIKFDGKDGYVHEENVSYTATKPSTPGTPGGEKPSAISTLRVNYSILNVREKPSTSSKVITTIADSSVHEYYDEARDDRGDLWYKIDKGWVHGDYVDVGPQKVTDIHIFLSTLEYTGNPIEVSAQAIGTNNALYRISLKQGTSYKVLSDFSENRSTRFTPTSEGSYTIRVEAKDFKASAVEKTFEQSFTLKKNLEGHSVTYVDYASLESFARSQVGRAVKWQDGYWVNASYTEIIREMDPQSSLTFTLPKANPSSQQTIRITGTVNVREGAGTNNLSRGLAYSGEEYQLLGSTLVDSETWYKVTFSGKDGWLHSDFAIDATKTKPSSEIKLGDFVTIISNGTALRSTASTSAGTISYLAANSSYMVLDRSGSWMKIQHSGKEGWVQNSEAYGTEEVNIDMYQFLDLRGDTGISAEELNKVLQGKGILSGQGAAFVEASRLHNINEIYLVSHALLETGNGNSALASGQVVSGTTVYNMYGIGAYDQDPVVLGAKTAYDNGWTTPEKAIIDGARWIAGAYVHNSDSQYTLYKMRYNYLDPSHQYATDISWAKSQTSQIKNLYGAVQGYHLRFEIPVYVRE
ncbi:MAG: SH3 domain-containing protein [Tissierellia bacterium]|nr:SH3 domain-containing protein [Tissierellia bacterium]